MKKACISTYCVWSSYGSMLQAFGLQHALRQIGCEGYIASAGTAPPDQWKAPALRLRNPKALIVDLHKWLIAGKIRRRYVRANAFIREHIHIRYFGSWDALKEQPPRADAYIAGSDQVWNPRKLAPDFFLDYVPEGALRSSYAASMGITKVPEEKQAEFCRLLEGFEHISLRERDNLPIIEDFCSRNAQVHIDPVFLVPETVWRELEVPYPMDEPYILVYPIFWDKRLNHQLEQLHKRTGKTIVAVLGQAQQVYANKRIYDASPEQFLWLIDHADAVVSSSFHGIAMSLVFQKPFAAVIDPKSPSRLTCLLETMGAENSRIEDLAEESLQDYGRIRHTIQQETGRSLAYLRKVMSLE